MGVETIDSQKSAPKMLRVLLLQSGRSLTALCSVHWTHVKPARYSSSRKLIKLSRQGDSNNPPEQDGYDVNAAERVSWVVMDLQIHRRSNSFGKEVMSVIIHALSSNKKHNSN